MPFYGVGSFRVVTFYALISERPFFDPLNLFVEKVGRLGRSADSTSIENRAGGTRAGTSEALEQSHLYIPLVFRYLPKA